MHGIGVGCGHLDAAVDPGAKILDETVLGGNAGITRHVVQRMPPKV